MDGEGHSFVENCKQLYCKLITIILQIDNNYIAIFDGMVYKGSVVNKNECPGMGGSGFIFLFDILFEIFAK